MKRHNEMLSSTTRQRLRGKRRITAVKNFIRYLVILCGAAFLILPFLWMLSTSLKPLEQIFALPPEIIPKPPMWENYIIGWTRGSFGVFFKNSTLVTSIAVVADIISSSLVAFAFVRLRCRAKGVLFGILIATMMIPFHVTIVPRFILFKTLRLVNTLVPLFIESFFAWPFFVFLLRQFFTTIPAELDDAAKIDGCSTFGIYWKVIVPLAKPALAAVAIFSFVGNWNNYLIPLIFISSEHLFTIPLGLNLFKTRIYGTQYHYLMAVSILAVLPIVIIFFIGQRYFIQGITLTGTKR